MEGILKGKEENSVTGGTGDEEKASEMDSLQIQAANVARAEGGGGMGGREEPELFVVWDPLAQV